MTLCESGPFPHDLPPNLGGVHALVLVFFPGPHETEHFPYAVQALITPSIAHFLFSHGCDSERAFAGQACPPNRGAVQVRVRDRRPGPHGVEHLPNAVQEEITPSTGQGVLTQATVILSWPPGQAFPPNEAGMHIRVLVRVALPQGAEHVLNIVHWDSLPLIGQFVVPQAPI